MDVIERMLDYSNQHVQIYLHEEQISTRPGASAGIWMSFLLPTAIIVGSNSNHDVSELYEIAVSLSLGLLGTSALFIARSYKCRTQDYAFVIPPVFTYIQLFFYNKVGVWFSIAGGFASYSFSEAVIFLLDAVPKSLTYGEASVLTQALILFLFLVANSLVNTWYNAPIHCVNTSSVIMQVGLLGLLLISTTTYFFPQMRRPLPFYSLTLGVIFGFVIPFLQILLQENPVLWIVQLMLSNTTVGLLVIYWVICSGLAVLAVNFQIQGGEQASTMIRKYFHILAVLVFIPGIIRECCFLYLATGVVLGLIIGLELLRVLNMPPVGEALQAGFKVFADEKDVGSIAFTPIYLMAGCSLPLWLYTSVSSEENYAGQHLLPLMSGLLTIGIGDTAASIFGTLIGKTKWKGTKKTVEGTLASIICQMTLILMLVYFVAFDWSHTMAIKTKMKEGNKIRRTMYRVKL
ncbi:dolichol kinase isoform X2 [Periplaneta americana]|uniref:dolichol kinase isoform X2 n=1 Tax=Periplaneta americana TaxID=6978 RepID=UPI0037E959BC